MVYGSSAPPQAEERLLRNLTIQAAAPPLGYPVYSSPPLTVTSPCGLAQYQRANMATK